MEEDYLARLNNSKPEEWKRPKDLKRPKYPLYLLSTIITREIAEEEEKYLAPVLNNRFIG